MKIFKRIQNCKLCVAFAMVLGVSSIILYTYGNATIKGPPLVRQSASGGVTGTVRFTDPSPQPEKIPITKDVQICGTVKYSKSLIISEETQGLKNVVVSVVDEKGKPPAPQVITLDQRNCEYLPRVQVAPAGSKLEILNNDGILHNVHAYFNGFEPKHTVFNKAQPKFLKRISQVLEDSGTYYFKCDVHNHMSAIIAVLDHPYYALTDEAGSFTINDVPAGSYTIQAWHEILGTRQKTVQVESSELSTIDIDMIQGE